MITKREVLDAIARCEPLVGAGPLDRTPTRVDCGDLAVLVEAAKRARFVNAYNGVGLDAPSDSAMMLADEY